MQIFSIVYHISGVKYDGDDDVHIGSGIEGIERI